MINRSDHLNYTPIIKVVHAILKYRKLPKTEADEHLKKYKDDIIFYSQMIEEYPIIPNLGLIKHARCLIASMYGNYRWIGYKYESMTLNRKDQIALEFTKFKICDAYGLPKFNLTLNDGEDEKYRIIHNVNDNQIIAKGTEVANIIKECMTDYCQYDPTDMEDDEFNTLVYFAIYRATQFVKEYEEFSKTPMEGIDELSVLLKHFSPLTEYSGFRVYPFQNDKGIMCMLNVFPVNTLRVLVDKNDTSRVLCYDFMPYTSVNNALGEDTETFTPYEYSILKGENQHLFSVVMRILDWITKLSADSNTHTFSIN